MEVLLVSDPIKIQSHKGEYKAIFSKNGLDILNEKPVPKAIYIIDSNIVNLYGERLNNILNNMISFDVIFSV